MSCLQQLAVQRVRVSSKALPRLYYGQWCDSMETNLALYVCLLLDTDIGFLPYLRVIGSVGDDKKLVHSQRAWLFRGFSYEKDD